MKGSLVRLVGVCPLVILSKMTELPSRVGQRQGSSERCSLDEDRRLMRKIGVRGRYLGI